MSATEMINKTVLFGGHYVGIIVGAKYGPTIQNGPAWLFEVETPNGLTWIGDFRQVEGTKWEVK